MPRACALPRHPLVENFPADASSQGRVYRVTLACALGLAAYPALAQEAPGSLPAPLEYIAPWTAAPPQVDGRHDTAWEAAAWSTLFVDIEGPGKPTPEHATRIKIMWDDLYLYIYGSMAEPHVWATLSERDAVIYKDDDFEVFIDPDGDTLEYYELEVNALGTVWDLLLTRPYRDAGRAIDAWDVRGLRHAVHVAGTLNDPTDVDDGWSVELALPWSVLEEAAPHGRRPRPGDTWRMNFSRVDWEMEMMGGRYVKRLDAQGRPLPERNWVWSPQGEINMHAPERWGFVTFGPPARQP